MENEEKTELFEKTPIPKAVMKLSVPMILSALTVIVYNMADTFFVGMLKDPIQSAAISLAAPMMMALNVISNLFGVGTASMMSRSLGAKEYQTVRQCSAFGFYGTVFSSLLLSVCFAVLKQPIMGIIGVQPDTEMATDAYMLWTITLGALPTVLHIVMLNIVRAEGESFFASFGIAVGCLLNVILDPIFVLPWGLNMGAEGAGCATFLSNCVSCIFYFGLLFKKREKLYASFSPKDFVLNRKIVFGVCGIGVPACIQTLLNVTGITVLNNFTVAYGATAVAAMGIVQKINSLPVNVALGGSQGVMPLISYTYASGQHERMKEAVSFSRKLMLGFLLICSAVFFIAAKPLTAVFMDNQEIVSYGTRFLRGFCLGLPFMCLDYMAVSIFQALGLGRYALLFAIARKIVLEIPALIILNILFPLYGLAYAQFVAELVLAGVSMFALKRLFRRMETEKVVK